MLYVVIILALLLVIWLQFPLYVNPYIINDDQLVHAYVYDYAHNDLLSAASLSWNPIGYDVLFRFLHIFFDIQTTGHVITLLVVAGTTAAAYLYGKRLHGRNFAALFSIFSLLTILQMPLLSGGHPRSFGFFFILLYLYATSTHLGKLVHVALVSALLMYPIAFLLLFLHYLVSYHRSIRRVALALLAYSPLVLFLYTFKDTGVLGSIVGLSTVLSHPVFSSGGYYHLVPFLSPFEIIWDYVPMLSIIFVVLFPFYRRLPRSWLLLLLSGVVLYAVALITGLHFYDYRRYIFYTAPLVMVLLISVASFRVFRRSRYTGITMIAVIGVALFIHIDHDMFDCSNVANIAGDLTAHDRVAGHPYDLSCLVLFSKAQILYSDEMFSPMYHHYFSVMDTRIRDYFTMSVASTEDEVVSYCEKYNLTSIFVRPERLAENFTDRSDHAAYYRTMTGDVSSGFLFEGHTSSYLYRCPQ
ncbi:hypothetical protein H6504_02175 [Candidatus Woesearchaeota archaeon]|nr:hypothetical protein [Candidatus Woesearchaeota archaeon]